MENVVLFVVLYDGEFVAMKTSMEDAIHLVYAYEFEQEFAGTIAMGLMPSTAEVEKFTEDFNNKVTKEDISTVFKWWKITPSSLPTDVLNFIKDKTSSPFSEAEEAAFEAMIAEYESRDCGSAKEDYYAHCDDIWRVGGSI